MLCKRCMVVMKAGTTYEQKKGQNKPSYKRYFECNKCRDRVYANAPNFQEYLNRISTRNGNR